jgi:hypothetical protein
MRPHKYTHIVSLVVIVGLLLVAGFTLHRNYRVSACDEIEAARKALQGVDASTAAATLRKYARSHDAFVRTQSVMAAGDIGPECMGDIRERCMEVVGEALNDPSGYVLHIAIQDIGRFGVLADRYIDALLAISARPHLTHAVFALESLGRIGPGRREVGDRLVKAIKEQYPIVDAEEYPYRTEALRVLRSWGIEACPWLPQLRHIRDSWHVERNHKPRIPEKGNDGPRLWAQSREDVGFEILTGVVETLENQCRLEKDRRNPLRPTPRGTENDTPDPGLAARL